MYIVLESTPRHPQAFGVSASYQLLFDYRYSSKLHRIAMQVAASGSDSSTGGPSGSRKKRDSARQGPWRCGNCPKEFAQSKSGLGLMKILSLLAGRCRSAGCNMQAEVPPRPASAFPSSPSSPSFLLALALPSPAATPAIGWARSDPVRSLAGGAPLLECHARRRGGWTGRDTMEGVWKGGVCFLLCA